MARIKEYPSITSFDGTNDALAIEQTDGANNRLRKVSPSQLKQYMEAGDFEATGEVKDGHGNILKDMAESTYVDNAVSGLIKVAYITGTTSANGNMQLTGLTKANTIVLGCQFMNTSNAAIVAIPYTYSNLNTGSWGVHCLMETGSYVIAGNMDLQGYVYYIDKRAYTS